MASLIKVAGIVVNNDGGSDIINLLSKNGYILIEEDVEDCSYPNEYIIATRKNDSNNKLCPPFRRCREDR